jgi:hypothetical protein
MPITPDPLTQEANDDVLWHKPPEHIAVYHSTVNPDFHVVRLKPVMWSGLPIIVYSGLVVVALFSATLLFKQANFGDLRSKAQTNEVLPTPTLIHPTSPTPSMINKKP